MNWWVAAHELPDNQIGLRIVNSYFHHLERRIARIQWSPSLNHVITSKLGIAWSRLAINLCIRDIAYTSILPIFNPRIIIILKYATHRIQPFNWICSNAFTFEFAFLHSRRLQKRVLKDLFEKKYNVWSIYLLETSIWLTIIFSDYLIMYLHEEHHIRDWCPFK